MSGRKARGRSRVGGHELGSHTLTHPRLTDIPDDEVRAEILGGVEAFEEVLGERSPLFRAPGFHAHERELAIVAELGLEAVFADVDPEDWRPEVDSHTIFRRVLEGARDGAIVDLHDGYPPPPTSARDDCTATVEALEHLLPCLRAQGYELVTLAAVGYAVVAGGAGGLAERVGLVGALPREVVVVAAEVAVRRGLRVDRATQVEVAQDRRRAEVEVLA